MFYIILAFLYGAINVINKMMNVEAKKNLGMTSGTLLNYIEASVIALLVILFSRRGGFVLAQLPEVPAYYFLGGVFSVFALVMIIIGTERCPVILSTTMTLAGQLTMSVLLDAVFFERFSLIRVLGIFLVLLGSFYNQWATRSLEPTK